LKAGQTTLKPLIEGEKQYRVPLFQRPFTWGASELRQMWMDILDQYEELQRPADAADRGTGRSLHFIGSFVLAPLPALPHGVASFLVIDGQQRLTALLLALAAARDLLRGSNLKAAERLDKVFLRNDFASDADSYKLLPTQLDRETFFACIDGESEVEADTKVAAAYRFFRAHMSSSPSNGEGERLDPDLISRVILERLSIVDIVTEAADNPNQIFESLNATGVGLTQGDLLRNHIFMLLPSRGEAVYREIWLPMERMLGSENLEGLARVDLQLRGIDANRGEIYKRQQQRLELIEHDETAVELEVRNLARRAVHYRRLVDPSTESDLQVRAALQRLQRWGAQTTYPLLMHVYDLVESNQATMTELQGVLATVESFLVRRYLLGVSTNQLNRLFIDLIHQLPKERCLVDAVRFVLSGERRYWPTDSQVREAVRTRPFYITGRADQRRLILEQIERHYGHLELVDLGTSKLSIEHIMPQTLSEEWRTMLTSQGENPDAVRDELGHTLGNLTLTAYNPALSNSPFQRKQEIYNASHLELSRGLVQNDTWGRSQILARADELADAFIEIWAGPLAGAKGAISGFDWTRVDAAVAAIPQAKWTGYGDLSLLGGTSAQSVGNRMASSGGPRLAYRVLDAQGRVSSMFRWSDPGDCRDPRQLLEYEGIRFDENGCADSVQRLSAFDLAERIPYEFDPDELARLATLCKEVSVETGDGRLWLVDGRTWHLDHMCSPLSREILVQVEQLVGDATSERSHVSWAQKYAVTWRTANGRTWLAVYPRQYSVWLEFRQPPFTAAEAATQMGYELLPDNQKASLKANGPAQVQAGNRKVWLQMKASGDFRGVAGAALAGLITRAWDDVGGGSPSEETPIGGPWAIGGAARHH
jgi:alkylated DNA nucleotide flippase Atl1